jgi:DNA-binding CsgD family transcriptional regulator
VDSKAVGYKHLVERFGAGEVADHLLAKWISDPDADQKWNRLFTDVSISYERERYAATIERIKPSRPFKYWVVLWYYSMGYRTPAIAEQLNISVHTIKRDLTYARTKLNLIGTPLAGVVAKAIRLGYLP